jgi:hypothetical protein
MSTRTFSSVRGARVVLTAAFDRIHHVFSIGCGSRRIAVSRSTLAKHNGEVWGMRPHQTHHHVRHPACGRLHWEQAVVSCPTSRHQRGSPAVPCHRAFQQTNGAWRLHRCAVVTLSIVPAQFPSACVPFSGEAFKKVSAIHRKLPDGGVLVFVTGQDEVLDLCRRLTKRFGKRSRPPAPEECHSSSADSSDDSDVQVDDAATRAAADEAKTMLASGVDMAVGDDGDDSDVDAKEVVTDRVMAGEAIHKAGVMLGPKQPTSKQDAKIAKVLSQLESSEVMPVHVLPLYSLLSKSEQMRVFQPPPAGHRLIVVATNVAETSLTIPNIRYVVDTGRAKQREYNVRSGTSAFVIDWISKASSQQV